jgi:hypothetical protein
MTSRHKKKKETDPKESSDSSSKQLGKGEFRAGIIRYTKKAGNVAPVRLDFGFQEVRSRGIWLSLVVEFVGTLLQTFISCGAVIASLNYGYNPPTVAIGIIHTILIPIYLRYRRGIRRSFKSHNIYGNCSYEANVAYKVTILMLLDYAN